jgi:hypothetical protein
VGEPATAARWAPAELNAIDEASLRAHVLAAVQPPADDEPAAKPPLLAPFITNAVLLRVREILVPAVEAGTLLRQLGYAIAALTGAPRPTTDEEAQYVGGKAAGRVQQHHARMKKEGKNRSSKASAARVKDDQEKLYVDGTHGSTPPAPSLEVLLAGLAAPVSPAPPPVDPVPVPTQKEQMERASSAPPPPDPAPSTLSSESQLALAPAVLAPSECTERANAESAVAVAARPVGRPKTDRLGVGLSEPEAIRIAEAEGLQLIRSASCRTGFSNVSWRDRPDMAYQAHWVTSRGITYPSAYQVPGRDNKGKIVTRSFRSGPEAALAYARALGQAGVAAAAAYIAAGAAAAAAAAAAATTATAAQAAAAVTARAERTLERSRPRPSVLPRRFDGTNDDVKPLIDARRAWLHPNADVKRCADKRVQEPQAKRQAQRAEQVQPERVQPERVQPKRVRPGPACIDQQGRSWWVVEQLLASRQADGSSGRGRSREFLVRWQDFGAEYDSWEPETQIVDAAKVRAFDAPSRGTAPARSRALSFPTPQSCAAAVASPPRPMGAWRARANAALHAQRIGPDHQATLPEVGCGDDAADGARRLPRAVLDHDAAQGVAALLTASAFADVGAFCFVAPCDCGLGLFARESLQTNQFIAE